MISESDVPSGWNVKNLGAIAHFQNGNGFSKSDWENEGRPIIRIQNLTGTGDSFNYYSGEVDDKYKVEKGDILFAWSGTIDCFRWHGERAWLNQHIYRVDTKKNVTDDYMYYLLKYAAKELERKKVGSGLQHIRKSHVEELFVPVPPLEEQERIVSIVEERLSRVAKLEQSVQSLSELVNEYEDSLLSYIVTGQELTGDSQTTHTSDFDSIPDNWMAKKLKDIGKRRSSMTTPETGKKYSLYSFEAVDSGEGFEVVDGSEIGSRKRELYGGEIMISRLNPRISRVQKVTEDHEHTPVASSEFVVIEINSESILPDYLKLYLQNPMLRERLTNHVTGSTGSRARVGFDFVMESKIPIPPIDTQERIIDHLTSINFSRLQKSIADVNSLFDEYQESVLDYAFTGEMSA